MKSFNRWTRDEIEEKFGLQRQKTLPALEEWLSNEEAIGDTQRQLLLKLQQRLQDNVDLWNEVEVKMMFISFLIDLAEYATEKYRPFFERSLVTKIGNEQIGGVVDMLIAQGRGVPKHPFFCLHEYKPDVPSSKDPLGQTLIAMVVAQQLNQNDKPVYGLCVVGRLWYFMVLDKQEYAVSLAYDATKDELFDIFKALLHVKTIIETKLL